MQQLTLKQGIFFSIMVCDLFIGKVIIFAAEMLCLGTILDGDLLLWVIVFTLGENIKL